MEESAQNVLTNGEIQQNKRKRRYSSSRDNNDEKDNKYVGNLPESNKIRLIDGPAPFQLLDFSDEMLFEIFQYLDTWTLMALMNSCTRLSSFVLDHRFWNYIDLSKDPLPLGILGNVLERSHSQTTCLKLHGPPIVQHVEGEDKRFNETMAKAMACCTSLAVLELQGITVDFRYIRIVDFPSTLKRFLLNNCNVQFQGEKSIFFGIDSHLTQLEELAIENSNWFEPYYMMVFSKLPELRSLSLKGCQLLSDFVPYGSMASRFGFKKLEFLDLRFTPISDSDLQCFNAVATLKEVLLDCPETLREHSIAAVFSSILKTPTESQNETASTSTKSTDLISSILRSKNLTRNTPVEAQNETASTSLNFSASPVPLPTGTSSPLRVTVSISPSCSNSNNSINDSGASTSAAAAAAVSASLQVQPSIASQSQSHDMQPAREDESSLSSCSSSPSASSSSSNESLPSLLTNSSRSLHNPVVVAELPNPGGNAPPFSRFLPRPDQIILLDLNNRWRHSVMQNPSPNREQRAEQGQQQQHQLRNYVQIFNNNNPENHNGNHNNNNNNNHNNNNHNNNNHNNNNNINNNNNNNQIEQVIHHSLFWDMVNPFAAIGRSRRNDRDDSDESSSSAANSRRYECRRSQCSGQYHQYHRHRHRLHHHPITDRGICCFGRPRNPVEQGIIWIRIGNRPSENRFERLSIRNYKMVTDVSLQHLVQCSPYLIFLDLSGSGVTKRGVDAFKERKPQCVIRADHLYDFETKTCTDSCTDQPLDLHVTI